MSAFCTSHQHAVMIDRVFTGVLQVRAVVDPLTLRQAGVAVHRLVQHPGEYVVTLPQAFHAGVSLGLNLGEAVNFGLADWLPYGWQASLSYRMLRDGLVSAERLCLSLAKAIPTAWDHDDVKILSQQLQAVCADERSNRARLVRRGFATKASTGQLQITGSVSEEQLQSDAKIKCCACRWVCLLSHVTCGCVAEEERMCLRCPHKSTCRKKASACVVTEVC
jgi:histone demethylase JARID1